MDNDNKELIGKFSFLEKLYAYSTFNIGIFIAAYGLFIQNKTLAVIYLFYSYIGIFLLMRYTVCPRCPHLLEANDCLNLPASITKKNNLQEM